jgi:hypothetical protein
MSYEDTTYTPKHENCAECDACLVEAHKALRFTCASTITTFSAEGDHCGTISR